MMAHLSTDSQDGVTALFMASETGHTSVVDALLKNGADPNLARTVSTNNKFYLNFSPFQSVENTIIL